MSKFSASGDSPIPPERKTLNIYYATPFCNFNVSIMFLQRSCKIQTSFKTPVFVVVFFVVVVFSKMARTWLLTKYCMYPLYIWTLDCMYPLYISREDRNKYILFMRSRFSFSIAGIYFDLISVRLFWKENLYFCLVLWQTQK